MFTEEQIRQIRQIIKEETNKNYTAGNPEVPPHTHDGVNSPYINGADISGLLMGIGSSSWTQSCDFSSTSATVVSWTSGTLITSSGNTYSISAGNTGAMSAKTYIYFDSSVSTTTYQVTTVSADSVGESKILIAVAQNGGSKATYAMVQAAQIVADNIIANSISVDKLQAGTLVGFTIKTSNTSTRVEINGGDNALYYYDNGNITAGLNGTGLFFNSPSGVASAMLQGFGSNEMLMTIAGSDVGYHFNTSYLYTDSQTDLGQVYYPFGVTYTDQLLISTGTTGRLRLPVGTNMY